jgi:hypothetical protein
MTTDTLAVAGPPETSPPGQLQQPLLARAQYAARLCGVNVRTWWRWHAAALVPAPVTLNGRPFWRVQELQAWVEAACPGREAWDALQMAKGGRP